MRRFRRIHEAEDDMQVCTWELIEKAMLELGNTDAIPEALPPTLTMEALLEAKRKLDDLGSPPPIVRSHTLLGPGEAYTYFDPFSKREMFIFGVDFDVTVP